MSALSKLLDGGAPQVNAVVHFGYPGEFSGFFGLRVATPRKGFTGVAVITSADIPSAEASTSPGSPLLYESGSFAGSIQGAVPAGTVVLFGRSGEDVLSYSLNITVTLALVAIQLMWIEDIFEVKSYGTTDPGPKVSFVPSHITAYPGGCQFTTPDRHSTVTLTV
jgi:hypothetical protein